MLVGPAKDALECATANRGELFVALVNNLAVQAGIARRANTAIIATGNQVAYDENCQWLMNTYAGAQVQQELQEDLMRIYQHSNESPKDFNTRIQHTMRLAAVADTAVPFLMQTIFI